jgi:serine protease Do
MRKFIAFGPALVVLVTALVTLVAAPAAVRMVGYAGTDAQIQMAAQSLEKDNILKQIDRAVRNIADAVEPSVVHVGVEEAVMDQYGRGRRYAAQGSGWVFDKAGHIVTNAHVVSDATRITVQFSDGRAADAEVMGKDADTDIAVLKVSTSEGLFPVARASGLALHQGDRVYAFGSPFGFKFSMSEGIVSGLGRDPGQILSTSGGYTNFIQTDAAVNPGNSGGPLVNVEGKLVGMNVAIATAARMTIRGEQSEGQNSGISFAIPLSTIERVVEQIVAGGVVTRGYMGIGRPADDEMNRRELARLNFHGRGVAVTKVEAGSPASKAGMLENDVITKIDGETIASVPALRSAIANKAPGEATKVEVWRAGKLQNVIVVLDRLISESDKGKALVATAKWGILDVADTDKGEVYVTRVRIPSPAYNAGVRPQLKVVEVAGAPIKNLEDFATALASNDLHQGHDVPMVLEDREGTRLDVKISGK